MKLKINEDLEPDLKQKNQKKIYEWKNLKKNKNLMQNHKIKALKTIYNNNKKWK